MKTIDTALRNRQTGRDEHATRRVEAPIGAQDPSAVRVDSSSAEKPSSTATARGDSTSPIAGRAPRSRDSAASQQKRHQLAKLIFQRIHGRLPARIRNLAVYVTENAVVIAGECSTYYSKQMAQHVAMGVLEYERLINNIDVTSERL